MFGKLKNTSLHNCWFRVTSSLYLELLDYLVTEFKSEWNWSRMISSRLSIQSGVVGRCDRTITKQPDRSHQLSITANIRCAATIIIFFFEEERKKLRLTSEHSIIQQVIMISWRLKFQFIQCTLGPRRVFSGTIELSKASVLGTCGHSVKSCYMASLITPSWHNQDNVLTPSNDNRQCGRRLHIAAYFVCCSRN